MKLTGRPFLSFLSFIITFIVYVITLAPDVTFTDSGELAGVCVTLGIAHPTGYPLFTLLGHLWSLMPLPFAKIYTMNLFSAITVAASVPVFLNINYIILAYISDLRIKTSGKKKKQKKAVEKPLMKIDKKSIAFISFTVALMFGFATTVWAQAVAIEVYGLQMLMANIILFLALKSSMAEDDSMKLQYLTALFLGLALANHLQSVWLLPALLFIYFKKPGKQFDISNKRINMLLLLFIPILFGLSLYLYLPLRSDSGPIFNWGDVARGFDKLLYHIQGKQYQVWMFSGAEVWKGNIGKFLSVLPYEFGFIGLIAFVYGFFKCYKYSRDIFFFLSILILTCFVFAINYSIHDIEVYFLLSFIGMIIFAAIGFAAFTSSNSKLTPYLIAVPIISLIINFGSNNRSGDYTVPEYTKILVDNLDSNAIIISAQWDYWCSAFWYKQKVEGYRTDVSLVEKELLRRTWYLGQLEKWHPEITGQCSEEMDIFHEELEKFESELPYDNAEIQRRFVAMINCFIDKNYGHRPVYITMDIMQTDPDIAKDYLKIPQGFALRLEKESNFPLSAAHIDISRFKESLSYGSGHLIDGIRNITTANFVNIGRYALSLGQKAVAEQAFNMAIDIDPYSRLAKQGLIQARQQTNPASP